MTLDEVADELAAGWSRLFLDGARRAPAGVRAAELLQTDPVLHDRLLFHEYFHGDTGAGLGASHQTGWTGLVADLIAMRGRP